MGNIGNLSSAKKELDDLNKKRQKLSNDLNKARARGDDKAMKEIQNLIASCEAQISVAKAAVNNAAGAIPRRF